MGTKVRADKGPKGATGSDSKEVNKKPKADANPDTPAEKSKNNKESNLAGASKDYAKDKGQNKAGKGGGSKSDTADTAAAPDAEPESTSPPPAEGATKAADVSDSSAKSAATTGAVKAATDTKPAASSSTQQGSGATTSNVPPPEEPASTAGVPPASTDAAQGGSGSTGQISGTATNTVPPAVESAGTAGVPLAPADTAQGGPGSTGQISGTATNTVPPTTESATTAGVPLAPADTAQGGSVSTGQVSGTATNTVPPAAESAGTAGVPLAPADTAQGGPGSTGQVSDTATSTVPPAAESAATVDAPSATAGSTVSTPPAATGAALQPPTGSTTPVLEAGQTTADTDSGASTATNSSTQQSAVVANMIPDFAQVGAPIQNSNPHAFPVFAKGEGDAGAMDPNDLQQGHIGDCFLIAALHTIARLEPDAIQNAITENPEGNYTVSMFDQAGNPVEQIVESTDLINPTKAGAGWGDDEAWGRIMEAAFANQTGRDMGEGGNEYEVFRAFTGKESSIFTVDSRHIDMLREEVTAGKMTTLAFSYVPPEGSGLISDHAYDLVGYDPETEKYQLWNPWAETNNAPEYYYIAEEELVAPGFTATVAEPNLLPEVSLSGQDWRKNEQKRSYEEVRAAYPLLPKQIVDWGFEQAGENGQPTDKVEESRVLEMRTLRDIMIEHKVPFDEAKKLYVGRSGGLIAGLADRGFHFGEITHFVGDFLEEDKSFDTNLLSQFVVNLENTKKEAFIYPWLGGANGRHLAMLANDDRGGLLHQLHERKLGWDATAQLIDKALYTIPVTWREQAPDLYPDPQELQLDKVAAFNEVARHRPNEWARNLIQAEQDFSLYQMTLALGNENLKKIVNDRHIGQERIDEIVDWALRSAKNDSDEFNTLLEEYNRFAKDKKRGTLMAYIDNGGDPYS